MNVHKSEPIYIEHRDISDEAHKLAHYMNDRKAIIKWGDSQNKKYYLSYEDDNAQLQTVANFKKRCAERMCY